MVPLAVGQDRGGRGKVGVELLLRQRDDGCGAQTLHRSGQFVVSDPRIAGPGDVLCRSPGKVGRLGIHPLRISGRGRQGRRATGASRQQRDQCSGGR
ncbi:hypothetical protein [Lysobacter gummosus]|uniref:hypothetical protein n=1 Tax=Lysobacter gummosus TaxID=262324 RepID=UPI00363FC0D4